MAGVGRSWRTWLRALAAAFQLLTRFPVPRAQAWGNSLYTEEVLRLSVVFYPVVGLAIGAVLAAAGVGLGRGLEEFVPLPVAGALLVVLWVALTGGLHLDGLMDTADGLLSGQPRERMLEIMKDSRAGAMGVIVCVLLLVVKTALLIAWLDLVSADGRSAGPHAEGVQAAGFRPAGTAAALLMLVPVWSRWFATTAMAAWNYARREGMGGHFRSVRWKHASAALLLALALSVAVVRAGTGSFGAAALCAAALLAVSGLCGWIGAARMARRLGGLTGDTYGALIEGLEAVLLLGVIVGMSAIS